MSKRRSIDVDWWQQAEAQTLPAKRPTGAANCSSSYDQSEKAYDHSLHPCFGGLALSHEGTLEVWLAVAAQVQDALASLPGWIQMTQTSQLNQPEVLSSLSSVSTPAVVQQHHDSLYRHHLPIQHSDTAIGASYQPPSPYQPSTSSPAPTRSATSPLVPVAIPAAENPAHPAAAGADSCTSDADTAAACGWFSKCRGCCQLTAGEIELQGQVVPLCRGCASSLHRRPAEEQLVVVQRVLRAHATLCQREAAGNATCQRDAGAGSS